MSTEKIMSFFCLRTSLGLLIHGAFGLAPKGLQDSAQGFNPGNPQNKWFALKGRDMRLRANLATHCGAKSQGAIETGYNWPLDPYFHLVRTFDLAPLQGASLWLVGSQG
jgi:hypothetical protein